MAWSRSKIFYWFTSIALAVPLLYFSLRGIDWSSVRRTLAGADLRPIAFCILFLTIGLFLRSIRWRILLLAEGRVSIPTAFWATSAGYFGNSFLPARAGEIVRTVMVSARAGLSRTYVFTTALSERMVDAITLVVISAIVLFALPTIPKWLADAAKPFAVLGFAGVIAIAVMPRLEPVLVRVLHKLPLPVRLSASLEHLLEQILLGVRSFHNPGRLLAFLGLTVVIWCLDALITVTGARSLGLVIPFPIAFLLNAGLGLGSALPSTPGYVGVYQFVAVSVLTPFGFRKDDAIAFILLFQVMQYVVFGLWGMVAFWNSRETSTVEPIGTAASHVP